MEGVRLGASALELSFSTLMLLTYCHTGLLVFLARDA